jgi:hypothetical protein|eukprot:COSAG01_NODE_23421_length_815_cov_403.037709_1_plen_142_part_00
MCRWIRQGKFLFQIIEATRGGMPTRDGNRSPRDDGSWGSRAKDFVICAEAALRGKKGVPYPLNNSSLGRYPQPQRPRPEPAWRHCRCRCRLWRHQVSSPFSDIPVATARSHDGQLTECVARGRMRVAGAVGVCEAVSGRGK